MIHLINLIDLVIHLIDLVYLIYLVQIADIIYVRLLLGARKAILIARSIQTHLLLCSLTAH